MGTNLEILKDIGIYDELGSELTKTYSFMETHADQIYKEVEDSVTKTIELYNDFIEMYTNFQNEVKTALIYENNENPSSKMNSIYERLEKYEQVLANDSVVGLKNKPMLNKLQRQNYALADKMSKNINENLKMLKNLNTTINAVQTNIPTEKAVTKIIDSKIDFFETIMKTAQNMLNKNMKQIVENVEKNLDLGLDKKIVQEVGLLKLYSLRDTVNFRCDEFYRKINKTERQMENMYDNGVSFVANLEQRAQKLFINHEVSEIVNGELLEKNFKTIDSYINFSYTTTASPNSGKNIRKSRISNQ